MPSALVETVQSRLERGNTRVIEGAGGERQFREELSHCRFVHPSFHDAVDRQLLHQKLNDS